MEEEFEKDDALEDNQLQLLEEINNGRYSGMESQSDSEDERIRKKNQDEEYLKKKERSSLLYSKKREDNTKSSKRDNGTSKRSHSKKRDHSHSKRRDHSKKRNDSTSRRDKSNSKKREKSHTKRRDHSTSKKRDHSHSKKGDHNISKRKDRSTSKGKAHSQKRGDRSSSKRKDHKKKKSSKSKSKGRNMSKGRSYSKKRSASKGRSTSKKGSASKERRVKNRSASKKRNSPKGRSYSKKRSSSKRRSPSRKQRSNEVNSQKSQKRNKNSSKSQDRESTKRSLSSSKKRKSSHQKKSSDSKWRKSRSKGRKTRSKGREDDSHKGTSRSKSKGKRNRRSKSKNRENTEISKDKKSNKADGISHFYSLQPKVDQKDFKNEEINEELMMELMTNSDDEREQKKQELLDMIKGIKNKNEKSQNNSNAITKTISTNQLQKEEMEEEGFNNDLINPEDAIEEDEEDNNYGEDIKKKRKIEDDYNGENDQEIGKAFQTSNKKYNFGDKNHNLDYLKNLEEMRNQEFRNALEGEVDEGNEQEMIQIEKLDSLKIEDTFDNFNKMHELEDNKEDSDSDADMFADGIEKFIGNIKYGKVVNAECDDEQNYFKIRVGEILAGKYRVIQKCGKGVFANVCKAEQLDNLKQVAIKILRSNEIMHESGEREKDLVQKLNLSDKNDKKHIIRLKNVFEHQKHICLVFECFAMNLREAMKQYGKGKGFSLDIVRSYAFQIFIAMTHLKKNRLIHADLKPDNLLISEDTKTLKMCDFGTALSVDETGILKYIQSRFYRAPEVLLGYPPYTQIDIWSIGVTLYEIYTQKYLFDGSTNNEMMKLIMDAKGKFNKKMLQSGTYVEEYFDANHVFQYVQIDPVTKQKYVTPIKYGDIPKNDISKLLQANKDGVEQENQKKLAQFKDFLEKCLQLDPKNRITPEEALKHPFLDTSVKKK